MSDQFLQMLLCINPIASCIFMFEPTWRVYRPVDSLIAKISSKDGKDANYLLFVFRLGTLPLEKSNRLMK